MVKGIAGCEGGCPINAKSLVAYGYERFKVEYVEGGILNARTVTRDGTHNLKMFPDF